MAAKTYIWEVEYEDDKDEDGYILEESITVVASNVSNAMDKANDYLNDRKPITRISRLSEVVV